MSEPDQIDMMSECELRTELREVLRQDKTAEIVALVAREIVRHMGFTRLTEGTSLESERGLVVEIYQDLLTKIKAL